MNNSPIEDIILTLNAGSSSLKFAMFKIKNRTLHPAAHGQIETLTTEPHLIAKEASGTLIVDKRWPKSTQSSYEDFLEMLLSWVDEHLDNSCLVAVGHRVVHGGTQFTAPVEINPDVMHALAALTPLAPLHQPHNLAAIEALIKHRPGLRQIACFDTAFHRGHKPVVDRFALPREYLSLGIQRYGFHGLSYEYIVSAMPRYLPPKLVQGKVIVAHLGNGSSLCAIKHGRSVDTTMGFTALDGLMMGTRCGSLDPGVLLFLEQQCGMTSAAVQDVLYNHSGLLGVSGNISSDMRVLLESQEPHAAEAIELFVFRIAREIGAMMMTMEGLDALIFTAGIGEHATEIRLRVCERLSWLSLAIDPQANARNDARISTDTSTIHVGIIPTNEEGMIAQHTLDFILPTPA